MKAHGLQGEVVLRSLSDAARKWKRGEEFFLSFDTTPKGVFPERLTLVSTRIDGEFIRVAFREITDRNTAEALIGSYLEVTERSKPTGKWFFYIDDLVGLTVVDMENRTLGKVIDVMELPASHVIEVQGPNGDTTLIPFLKRFVKSVELSTKTIQVKLMPGLVPWVDEA